MKNTKKVMTTSLLMALMCAAAATMASAKPVKANGQLAVRDVLTADISKDVTGRFVKRQADAEAMNVVSDVKAQISDVVDGVRHIRFVAAIDSHMYDQAKFNIVVKNGDEVVKTFADKAVTTAYTHIEANGNVLSAAEAFGDEKYNFMLAYTINNVPAEAWGYTFEATVAIKTAEAEDFTVSEVAHKTINKVAFDDAIGTTFASVINEDLDSKTFAWDLAVENGTVKMNSRNDGTNSSKSSIKFELEKASVVSFDYSVSCERNYDHLAVNVYATADTTSSTQVLKATGDSTETLITGSFIYKLEPGNVIEFVYSKDSSGNRGLDHVTVENLFFTDGIPAAKVTRHVNDGVTATEVVSANLMETLGDILAAPENVRGDNYAFDAWYYDAELTQVATANDMIKKVDIALYANWLEKVTVNFVVPEGASEVAPANTWTRTPMDVANPTMFGNIFRGWYYDAEFTQPANIAVDGVNAACTLYAKFEVLPVGTGRDVAHVVDMAGENIWSVSGVRTTEEFQTYYFMITPEVSGDYFILFDNYAIEGKVGTAYNHHARIWVEDTEGNVLSNEFQNNNKDARFALEAGRTYYLVFNGSKYSSTTESWGTFDLSVCRFDHNTADTAIDYAVGETVDIAPNVFIHRQEERVYKFTAETSDVLALQLSTNSWAQANVYKGAIGGSTVASAKVSNSQTIIDLTVEAGATYYVVLSHNWASASEFAKNEMSFSVKPYAAGYSPSNPAQLTLGEEITTDFAGGRNQYFAFSLAEDTVVKLNSNGTDTTNTRYIEIYDANNLSKAVLTVSGVSALKETFVNLPAGNYVMKAYYKNTSGVAPFTVMLEEANTGETILKPTTATLPQEAGEIAEITAAGYYSFTTGNESVFHFFTTDDKLVVITIMDTNGNVLATSTNGEVYKKLNANTTYVLHVDATAVVNHHIEESIRDGKSQDTALVYTDVSQLENDRTGSHEVWYEFTVEETGTYTIYTLNNGTIDTKAWVYDASGKQIAYNDDGGSALMTPLGGYRYDTYQAVELEAGQTVYVKVTYSISNSNSSESGINLHFYIVKQ